MFTPHYIVWICPAPYRSRRGRQPAQPAGPGLAAAPRRARQPPGSWPRGPPAASCWHRLLAAAPGCARRPLRAWAHRLPKSCSRLFPTAALPLPTPPARAAASARASASGRGATARPTPMATSPLGTGGWPLVGGPCRGLQLVEGGRQACRGRPLRVGWWGCHCPPGRPQSLREPGLGQHCWRSQSLVSRATPSRPQRRRRGAGEPAPAVRLRPGQKGGAPVPVVSCRRRRRCCLPCAAPRAQAQRRGRGAEGCRRRRSRCRRAARPAAPGPEHRTSLGPPRAPHRDRPTARPASRPHAAPPCRPPGGTTSRCLASSATWRAASTGRSAPKRCLSRCAAGPPPCS